MSRGSRRTAALAVVLTASAAGGWLPRDTMPWKKLTVGKDLTLEAPPEWKVAKRWGRRDPELVLTGYDQHLKVRLLGGKGSEYKTPEDYLSSIEAAGDAGPAEQKGTVEVAGREVPLYRAEFKGEAGAEEVAHPVRYKVVKEFVLVGSAAGRFYVVSYSVSSHHLLTPKFDEALWKRFLAGFKPSAK